MKVSGKVFGVEAGVLQQTKKSAKEVQNQANVKPNKIGASRKEVVQEKVQISNRAQELQRFKKVVAETPVIREEKVATVKEALAKGSYKVNSKDVAIKLLQNSVINNVFSK